MATISRLSVGQVLYDVRKNYRGRPGLSVFPVLVKEIDTKHEWIVASWNHNPARKMYPSGVQKLRVRKPEKKS